MWCLETIVAINKELASGKNLDDAHKACGIKPAFEKLVREKPPEIQKIIFNNQEQLAGRSMR